MPRAPLPPLELCERVGSTSLEALRHGNDEFFDAHLDSKWWDPDDPLRSYERLGREVSLTIRAALPQQWEWRGKRVLDFGCGPGRVLSHFLAEAQEGELWGCEIDGPSVAWLNRALCPPLHALHSGEWPPLPLATGSFDLIYATSVYTHLTDNWSAWMLEHHRLLRPGGLLLATFAGRGMCRWFGIDEGLLEREGAIVVGAEVSWDEGGPAVFHAEWWIRRHWARAFEVLNLVPDGFAMPTGTGQGWALLRRREVDLAVGDLERD